MKPSKRLFLIAMLICISGRILAQEDLLPPVLPWSGKSQELIAPKTHPWITPVEQTDFVSTPTYAQTLAWLKKLCGASELFEMTTIGKSVNGRDIQMVIGSQEQQFSKDALSQSNKPVILIQAGIHAGEIDGKDAGMMLLRDIAFGKKKDLLRNVNILFIPILNVDGHERTSPNNRVNQRGPSNMGWRTNAQNLNLNRDYTKLDTEEIRAVVKVMNEYNPALYLDLHVTDGADYQYDITYGYSAHSPAIFQWLDRSLKPFTDQALKNNGHIPGPLMFAVNDRDFTQGNLESAFAPRFSNNYGDLRHIPSILVENHSLKPFKQRVLGTYVFLESVITLLAKEGDAIKKAMQADRKLRNEQVAITWQQSERMDSMLLEGIESRLLRSTITNNQYVAWTGKPVVYKISFIKIDKPEKMVKRPKAYWIPGASRSVIERIKMHGIQIQEITTPKEVTVKMYQVSDHKFSNTPFEGHFSVTAKVNSKTQREIFYPGAIRIETDQPLGDLAIHLLEPESPDSFFQWGFFPEIFSRTEYIEEYAIEPLAKKMLATDEKIRAAFEKKKQEEPDFLNNPAAVYEWFYSRSPYVDQRYLLYPIGVEE